MTDTIISVASQVATPWRGESYYLYGTDTVLTPRDAAVARALGRLGIGAELRQPPDSLGVGRDGRAIAEIALSPEVVRRIRFLRVMPLVYLWSFDGVTLVMPVSAEGRYEVLVFEGAGHALRGEEAAMARSLRDGRPVAFRPPHGRIWPARGSAGLC